MYNHFLSLISSFGILVKRLILDHLARTAMRETNIFIQLFTLLLVYALPTFSDAARPITEINGALTPETPYYQVPEGGLKDVIYGVKDYAVIMLITTRDPKYNCVMCAEFDPVYVSVINAIWGKYPELKDKVAFARVEAADNLSYLKDLGITSVPQIWGFPNSIDVLGVEKYGKIARLMKQMEDAAINGDTFIKPDWYDIEQAGMEHYIFQLNQGETWDVTIHALAGFIGKTINVDIHGALREGHKGSFDWTTTIQSFAYFIIIIKAFQHLKKNSKKDANFWEDKRLYCYICVVLIFFNLSGFNFTVQKQAPFISQKEGKLLWVSPQSNMQFGAEIIIAIGIQILFSALLIFLIDIKDWVSPPVRDILICGAGILLLLMLFVGVDIYHFKNTGYPFHYLKLF